VVVCGWRLDAGLRLDVALSGSFLSLEHGGRQMLGSRSRGLLDLKHAKGAKVGYREMVDLKVTRTRRMVIKCTKISPLPGGLFIGAVRGSDNNVRMPS
jgi:hypothetical protein